MSTTVQERRGSAASFGEVFAVFLRLGLTSFGGPIAHLGYFRAEFVERRRWLGERAYADIVALSQFLPGPASSQTGFAIGLLRGGPLGGVAAWCGFTLPSAIALVVFAYGAAGIASTRIGAGVLHGLMLVAVAIVAQAVLGMARSLCPDRSRATIAVLALAVVMAFPGSLSQVGAIVAGGLIGLRVCRGDQMLPEAVTLPISRIVGVGFLLAFFALLALSFVPTQIHAITLFNAFYRSGALVFGGGHVVLPLLRDAVVTPGLVSDNAFLAGYGAAQAVPGPLFTFAAYLGTVAGGIVGAVVALLGIFLPGICILLGTLPFWNALRSYAGAQAAMRGVNAAVVGLLGAALYDPVWTSAVHTRLDFAAVVAGFVALVGWRLSPLWVVIAGAAVGLGQAMVM